MILDYINIKTEEERAEKMEKKRKTIMISIVAVVIIFVITTIAVIVLNQKNEEENQKIIVSELYNKLQQNDKYTITTTLDDNNRMYYAKNGSMAYLSSITNGDELELLVKDGNTYLIKDDEEIYYTYQNNETELSRITTQLEELSSQKFEKGKEKIEGKTYNYNEYYSLTDFAIQDITNGDNQEEQNAKTFQQLTKSMHDSGIRAARLNAVYIPLVLFCSTVAVAIVLLRGGYMVTQQMLEIATLSTFTTYAVGIFEPIQMTAANIAEFISLQASIERVTGLMDQVPQVKDTPEVEAKYGDVFHPKRENWEPLQGEIEFRDVTFRYPDGGENVLEHFSLRIPAGTTVAIVGETGAGKSTLVNLACRFFEPTEGQILIDGRDYRERSQLWLHSNIGYVLQNPHLFSGTVRENIRYGRLDATDEEIEAAAKAVSADTVVAKLEHGWDSDVGEGGDRLSTGEKQLISFARAVLANPRIFVLDEATSSIDTQTEQLIQAAIDHLLQDRTSFLIAHRLSTIRKADLILVVKDGKIVEQGKHLELLKKGGYYHDLYSKQFAEETASKLWRKS